MCCVSPPTRVFDPQIPLLEKVPNLRVVLEHITTKDAVRANPSKMISCWGRRWA